MKKFTILLILPIFALLFSGCSLKKKSNETPAQQNIPIETPPVEMRDPDTIILDPLPNDDLRTIDSELENISQDMESALNMDNANDLSDSEIGL